MDMDFDFVLSLCSDDSVQCEAGSDFEDLTAQVHSTLEKGTADKASILHFVPHFQDKFRGPQCVSNLQAVCQDLLSKLAESGVRISELQERVIFYSDDAATELCFEDPLLASRWLRKMRLNPGMWFRPCSRCPIH